jgi:TorA maturation chaperone TorD
LTKPTDPELEQASATHIQKVNVARAAIYNFLSRAFKVEIDEKFLESIVAIEPTIRALGDSQNVEEIEELEKGSRELHEFALQVKALKDDERRKLLEDLAVEYASLFLGVGQKHVSLAESTYLGKEHLLYEEPYNEIIQAYKSLGFEKEKDFHEPEDHLAVEFEFMAMLCQWTSQTLEKEDVESTLAYLNLQREFLRDHLLKWVPDLCRKLEGAAANGFYKALAHLTFGFITIENEMPDHMKEVLEDVFPAERRNLKKHKDSSATYIA